MQHPISSLPRLALPLVLLAGLAPELAAQRDGGGTKRATQLTAVVGTTTNAGPTGPRSASGTTTFGSFAATADFGTLSASATISIGVNGSDDGLSTRATFEDDITITAPGVPMFTLGTLDVTAAVRGGPSYSQNASSGAVVQGINTGYQVFVTWNGGTEYAADGSILYGSGMVPPLAVINSVPAPGVVTFDMPFSFGVPFTISAFLSARAAGNNTFFGGEFGSISGTTDVTFTWGGITSIRDLGGTEYLGTATVASASGTDWVGAAAIEAVRLGSPPNPNALLPGVTSGPAVGAIWDPVIDHSTFFPTANVDFLLLSGPNPINTPWTGGTLLCNLPPPPRLIANLAVGTPFQVSIPNDFSLVGLSGCTQGASFRGGVLQLTNALDITIGSY